MSENQKRLHVQHYYSTNKNSVPEVKVGGVENENALIDGEIAINHADEKLFIKKNGATDSNDVVTFSSDEKLDEKYAPKKDYVVNGENEGGVHIDTGGEPTMGMRPVIHMGEFEYNTNGGFDSANGIGILVEEDIESSGLIVESGYVKLTGESESCSSSTGGGSVELFSETVKLTTWNDPCEGDTFVNTLRFNKDGLNVEIDNLEGDFKNFSVNKDGLIFDGSRVVTEQILDEHDELVKVDENGVVNKSEITIGTFEIKNDKPYNYTLEGSFEGKVIETSYDGEPSQLVTVYPYDYSGGDETDWCYKFIVTSEHDSTIPNHVYIPSALIDGDYKSEYYSLLNFTEDVSETFSIYTSHDGEGLLSNAKIIRSVPFSLKHTSKVLLNGVPVATVDMLSAGVAVDSALSTTSVNPVQNKVITNKINELVDKNEEIESNFAELNEKIDSSKLILTTWSNLKSLKNTNKLIPGTKYRITDYVATSITENTTCNTNSSFDIIVTAISENELDEVATTISKDNANEEIYKIWYSLLNDSERFAWADTTNGKGVIYRMIDKYNNDAPYDFRNILFKKHNEPYYIGKTVTNFYKISENDELFTFSYIKNLKSDILDGTLYGLFSNNKIEAYYIDGKQYLNNNILISYEHTSKKPVNISNIILDKNCYNNTLSNSNDITFNTSCYSNYIVAYSSKLTSGVIFEHQCHDNMLCGFGYDIKFGGNCAYNIISSQSGNIIFHNDVVGNIIGATNTYYDGKTFTDSTFYNNEWIGDESELENKTIFDIINEKNININYGTSVKYITLKHNARFNIIGNGAQLITIDDRSHHNIIGECVTRVNMGKVCYNNIIYNQGYTDNIAPKTYPSDIILENKTMVCTIGDETSNNSTYNIHINQNCYKVRIPSGSENVTIGNNVWCVDNSNKLKNVLIKDDNAHMSIITEGESDVISNYTIESGTNVNDGKTDTEKVTLTLNYPNSSTPLIIYKDGNDIIEKLITSNNSQEAIVKENYNSLVTNPSFYPIPGKKGAAPTTNNYNGCLAIGGYNDYNGGICNANGSFAGGANCIANSICSVAYGVDVITTKKSGKYGEAAFGMYNNSSGDTLFSLGNGDSINNRKNAFEVKKDGSGIFASNVTASAFYESSDERLKTFGDDIDVDLNKLAELRKSFFTFNSKPEKMELGVSAQEIQKLYPEIVNENEDGFLSVDYSKLSVIALKAIDKLNAKNKELEERLARIEKALNLQ